MKFPRRGWLWLAAGLVAGPLFAHAATNLPPALPPLPGAQSPVAVFRTLLALPPAEQKQYLADRSPEARQRILAKLREYESLKPDQRELRLRATELRWFLLPLLNSPATNRAAQLALIPDALRQPVEDRLREWDQLPAAAQQELLENEATLDYFTQLQTGTEEQKQAARQNLSPARREKLEAGIASWQTLPAPQREKMLARFSQFFDLTAAEKAKALHNFSDTDRQQMEKTLARFAKLPKPQREQCVQSFAQFTAMSLDERQQFLKNAERWKLMPPEERQRWRELVQKVPPQPPLPMEFSPRPLQPPMPPGLAAPVATNKS